MSWYKQIKAQMSQPYLFSEEEMNQTSNIAPEKDFDYSGDLEEDLYTFAQSYEDSKKILDHYGWDYWIHNGPISTLLVAIAPNTIKNDYGAIVKPIFIIDDETNPELKDAKEWISNLWDHELSNYYEMEEENFWDGVGDGETVYHGTHEENVKDILRHGIESRNESRGISNRSMGSAVFTSQNLDTALNSSYTHIFEINVGAMKADGYMPRISGEDPLDEAKLKQSFAWELGLRDYEVEVDSSDGLSGDTVVIYGDIPPKYIRLID